jgi:hypothetical protein
MKRPCCFVVDDIIECNIEEAECTIGSSWETCTYGENNDAYAGNKKEEHKPRYLSLIKTNPDFIREEDLKIFPFSDDMPLLFLGEIPQMPDHCVVSGFHSGKIYAGYHTYNFVEMDEDEC